MSKAVQPQPTKEPDRMLKLRTVLFTGLGSLCVALGLIGIFVPILPTTPFLLLAAYFFARSSNRMLQWLLNNRWFGAYIRNYREGRGMALRSKGITLLLLWLTIGFSTIFVVESLWVRILLLSTAVGVTIHLIKIKTYHPNSSSPITERPMEIEES